MRKKLDGTITGIDPGAGLTRLSKKAIKDYGLDYRAAGLLPVPE